MLKPESFFRYAGAGMEFVFFFGRSNFWLIAGSYSHIYHMNDSRISKQNVASTWIGHLFQVQIKNDFGFILRVKFGSLYAKLNLSFGLRIVLKNLIKD